MRKRRKAQLNGTIVNTLIIAMIAMLYISTNQSVVASLVTTDAFYSPPVYRGRDKESVAFMMQVDYEAQLLETILDTLSQSDTRITVAVSGKWAENNPKLLKRMINDGHEIATMGYESDKDGDENWVLNDVAKSLDTVELISGVRPTLYYSGENRNIPVSSHVSKKLSLTQTLCTLDLLCAKGDKHDLLKRAEKIDEKASIILIKPTKAMSESLGGIIEILNTKGIKIAAVSDIL